MIHPLTPPEPKAAAMPDLQITGPDPFAAWITARLAPRRCDPALIERIARRIEALTVEQPTVDDVAPAAADPGPAHPILTSEETAVTSPQPLACNQHGS